MKGKRRKATAGQETPTSSLSSILTQVHPWELLDDLDWERADPHLWQRLTRTPLDQLTPQEIAQIPLSFLTFAERFFRIKERPDPSNPGIDTQLVPFRLNPAQRRFFREMTGNDIILKARQLGFSTLIVAYYFYLTVTKQNVVTAIVSHEQKSSEALMQQVHSLYQNIPVQSRPEIKYSSKYEMSFPGLNSRIFIMTAGSPEAARGMTITNLHCSEVASWPEPEKLVASLLAAGPPKRVVFETTAKGIGGWFYDFWHKAERAVIPFAPHFYNWTLEPLYRLNLKPDEEIEIEPGLDAEQTKFAQRQRAIHGNLFPQEYPMNSVECFVGTSRSVFDMDSLQAYLKVVSNPKWIGEFGTDGRFYNDKHGRLSIWAAPKNGHNYVIGVDVSEGLDRGDGKTDYSVACVIDQDDMNIVAIWRGYIDCDEFADELFWLGQYFGGVRGHALLAVENATFGGSTLKSLVRMKYPKIYYQTSIDKRTKVRTDRMGWRTDSHSKPMMIAELGGLIRDGKLGIPDKRLVEECMTFVRTSDTNGAIMGAESGCHDDMVIAAAIAAMMLTDQPIQRPFAYAQEILDPWRKAKEEKKAKEGILGEDVEWLSPILAQSIEEW